MSGKRILAILLATCLILAGSVMINNLLVVKAGVQAEFYVATDGDDTTGDGSTESPWATINKARDHIRTNDLNDDMTGDIIVCVAAGDYYVTSTISFDVQDSGTNGYKVIYKNKDAKGSAHIIGGQQLTDWTVHSGDIWKVDVGGGWIFHTLYENDKRARKARDPNYEYNPAYPTSKAPYLLTDGNDNKTQLVYKSNDLDPGGWDISDAEVVLWPYGYRDWTIDVIRIQSINTGTRTITLEKDTSSNIQSGARYFVQGVLQTLDQAGEFYLDESSGWLYYWPQDGNPNSQVIMAPKVREIFSLAGSSSESRIHDVQLEGLKIGITDFTDYHQRFDDTCVSLKTGTITLKNTERVDVRFCHLKNTGDNGIHFDQYNKDNSIYGCWIEHTGGSGICERYDTLDNWSSGVLFSEGVKISNCKIHNFLELKGYGGGIFFKGGMKDTEVSYCELYEGPEYGSDLEGGVYVNGGVTNADIDNSGNGYRYVLTHDVCQDRGDDSGLNMAWMSDNTSPQRVNNYYQCWVKDITNHSSVTDINHWGVRLDDGTADVTLQNIKVENVEIDGDSTGDVPGYFNQNGYDDAVKNNVSWIGGFNEAQMDYTSIGLKVDFPAEYGERALTVAVDNGIAGYANPRYSESGTWYNSTILWARGEKARYNESNSVSEWAKWQPYLPFTGDYEVWVWKFGYYSGSSTAAKYMIYYNGGSQQYTVNQQTPVGQWEYLGTHSFAVGTSGYVKLTADGGSGKEVRADAVKFVFADALPTPTPAPTPTPTPTPGIIHNYRLENNADDSVGTNNGTAYGGATYSSSDYKEGSYSGGSYDGTNDYINVDNISFPSAGNAYTIAAWVKPTESVAQWKSVMHVGDKSALKFTEFRAVNGKFSALYYNGTTDYHVNADATYSVDTWYHLVMTYDGTQLKFWVDKTAQNNGDGVNCTTNYDTSLRFDIARCYEQRGTALYWPGKVDDVRMYDYVLNQADINALYDSYGETPTPGPTSTPTATPTPTPTPGPVPTDSEGHWKLDETSGTTATDSSGNGRNGTVYNDAVWNSEGHKNGCLEFDGVNDYVEIADNSDLDIGTTDFSISLWFYRYSNEATNLRSISKGSQDNTDTGYAMWVSDTQVIAGICNGTTRIYTTGVSHSGVNAWSHVVVNYDRDGDTTIYINGQSATSTSISSMSASNIDSTYPLRIGRSSASGIYWDGLVDEVRVFKRLLTQNEITSLYNE